MFIYIYLFLSVFSQPSRINTTWSLPINLMVLWLSFLIFQFLGIFIYYIIRVKVYDLSTSGGQKFYFNNYKSVRKWANRMQNPSGSAETNSVWK